MSFQHGKCMNDTSISCCMDGAVHQGALIWLQRSSKTSFIAHGSGSTLCTSLYVSVDGGVDSLGVSGEGGQCAVLCVRWVAAHLLNDYPQVLVQYSTLH